MGTDASAGGNQHPAACQPQGDASATCTAAMG